MGIGIHNVAKREEIHDKNGRIDKKKGDLVKNRGVVCFLNDLSMKLTHSGQRFLISPFLSFYPLFWYCPHFLNSFWPPATFIWQVTFFATLTDSWPNQSTCYFQLVFTFYVKTLWPVKFQASLSASFNDHIPP